MLARLVSLQLLLAMTALVVIGAVTVSDVFLKYVFSRPIAGAYDLVESLLPVVIFHGMPATLLRRQNIVIDLIDHLAGRGRTRFLVVAADIIVLALLALVTAAMVTPALQAFDYGDRKLELELPIAVIWVAAIAGMAGSVIVAGAVIARPSPATAKAD